MPVILSNFKAIRVDIDIFYEIVDWKFIYSSNIETL